MELYYIDVSTCPFNRVYTPIQFIIRIKKIIVIFAKNFEKRGSTISNRLLLSQDFSNALRQLALDAMLNSFLPIDRSATARAKFKLNENLSFLRISFFSPKIRTFRIKYKQTNSSLEASLNSFLIPSLVQTIPVCREWERRGGGKKEGNK